MIAPLTITVPEAAKRLGAPKAAVQRVAEDLGLLIYFGNRKRIDPNDLKEIMDSCRSTPKARASIAAKTPACGSSATPAEGTAQQALETAKMLKGHSRSTSQKETAHVVQLRQAK